jgi:hypothetical protein
MGADGVHIHFDGILVHLVRSVPMVGTVRLVDFPSYSGSHDGYTVIRHARVGQARGTIERIDPQAAIILDEGLSTPPALPEVVFRVWMELRQLLGEVFHVSFNATGVYLGMAVRKGRTPMLAASASPPNRPEDLAEDVELLQRAIKATELLRRMFP